MRVGIVACPKCPWVLDYDNERVGRKNREIFTAAKPVTYAKAQQAGLPASGIAASASPAETPAKAARPR
eukprot:10313018-Prorocentrum_lima.AAC.1